jgi:hypothetical protein
MSSPASHDGPPVTFVHGPHPRIDYAPGSVSDPPSLSLGDLYDPRDTSRPGLDPDSTCDIGALGLGGPVDQGIEPIIPEGASGSVIPRLVPAHDDLPTPIELPATSAIAGEVPWQNPARPQTTPTTSVWPGAQTVIGVNEAWPGFELPAEQHLQ